MYNDKMRLFREGNLNLLIFLFFIDLERKSQFVSLFMWGLSCPFDKTGPVNSFNYSLASKYHELKNLVIMK